jgi:hypothetical protein
LRECLDDARIFITIYLYDVDESDFGLGAVAEWFKDGGVLLRGSGRPVRGVR